MSVPGHARDTLSLKMQRKCDFDLGQILRRHPVRPGFSCLNMFVSDTSGISGGGAEAKKKTRAQGSGQSNREVAGHNPGLRRDHLRNQTITA